MSRNIEKSEFILDNNKDLRVAILDKALEFEKCGLMGMDAIHIACAEKAKADFFVTCDDNLIKKLKRIDKITILYYNVIDFASREVFKI